MSPSLGCDSPLDQKIKGNLLADTFSLIGIVPLDQRDDRNSSLVKPKKVLGLVNGPDNLQNPSIGPNLTIANRLAPPRAQYSAYAGN